MSNCKRDQQLSAEQALLAKYLSQYKVCLNRKKTLEQRKREIEREFDSPLSAVNYDGMPKAQGTVSPGCASLSIRLDEITCRINEQSDQAARVLLDIMDVLEFLPENEIERSILEHRYIDRYGWDKICKVESVSRSPAIRYWRKGLDMLLSFKKVKVVLDIYKQEVEPFVTIRGEKE